MTFFEVNLKSGIFTDGFFAMEGQLDLLDATEPG